MCCFDISKVGESSIDFSEGVYLNDFDRLLGKHKQKLQLAESAAAATSPKFMPNSSSPCTSNKTKTLHHTSHIADEETNYFDDNQMSQLKNDSLNETNTHNNNNNVNNNNNNTVSGIQRTPSSTANRSVNFDDAKRTKHAYKNESTSTSAGAISTVTSLSPHQANHCPDDQTESVDKPRTSPGKLAHVRVDKHVNSFCYFLFAPEFKETEYIILIYQSSKSAHFLDPFLVNDLKNAKF